MDIGNISEVFNNSYILDFFVKGVPSIGSMVVLSYLMNSQVESSRNDFIQRHSLVERTGLESKKFTQRGLGTYGGLYNHDPLLAEGISSKNLAILLKRDYEPI